jgi:imidazolonepropionase-like amidohydrolase
VYAESGQIEGPAMAKGRIFFASILLLAAGCAGTPHSVQPTDPRATDSRQVPTDALVIQNGTVITGTGSPPIPDGVVIIQGERILASGPRAEFDISTAAKKVDAQDGTIMPGIINAHMHGGASPSVRRFSFLLKGVTSVCDMGSPLRQMPLFTRDHAGGPAARGFRSGPMITAQGGYPDIVWHMDFNYDVANPDEARSATADLLSQGADFIKIALEPGGEGNPLPMLNLEEVRAVAREAHALGTLVRAHVGSTSDLKLVDILLNGGVDVVEHAPVPIYSASEAYELIKTSGPYAVSAADKDLVSRLAAQHVIMVPTLTIYEPLCKTDVLTEQETQECYDLIEEPVREFHALGGAVALGNDYGAGETAAPGIPLREMQLLMDAGLTPMAVIQAGTQNAARVCGHGQELGTLEPGKLADVIIVEGNPLEDMEAMSRVLVVIKGGEIAYP